MAIERLRWAIECLEKFQCLENCDEDESLYRWAVAYAEDAGIILTRGIDENLNRQPAWFEPPVGAGLEGIPASELYAARGAQLKAGGTPVTKELHDMLVRQLEKFRDKFGREAGPRDPVFFDEDAIEPIPLRREKLDRAIVEIVEKAGIDPAFIYVTLRALPFDIDEIKKQAQRTAANAMKNDSATTARRREGGGSRLVN